MVKFIAEAVRSLMQGHVQHFATPERKQRRALVRTMGRRQAVSHVKGLRSLARVEARIEEIAKSKGELPRLYAIKARAEIAKSMGGEA